jgi:hypothetical protein
MSSRNALESRARTILSSALVLSMRSAVSRRCRVCLWGACLENGAGEGVEKVGPRGEQDVGADGAQVGEKVDARPDVMKGIAPGVAARGEALEVAKVAKIAMLRGSKQARTWLSRVGARGIRRWRGCRRCLCSIQSRNFAPGIDEPLERQSETNFQQSCGRKCAISADGLFQAAARCDVRARHPGSRLVVVESTAD